LEKVHIENYNLGAHYCRQLCEKCGVAIFVHNSLSFSNIDNAEHCEEQDIEICALRLSFGTLNICVLTLYRAPSGNAFYSDCHVYFSISITAYIKESSECTVSSFVQYRFLQGFDCTVASHNLADVQYV